MPRYGVLQEWCKRGTQAAVRPGKIEAEPERALARTVRVYVAAENRLLREALSRMLAKRDGVEVVGLNSRTSLDQQAAVRSGADVMLLMSDACIEENSNGSNTYANGRRSYGF